MLRVFILGALLAVCLAEKISYDGYQVLRITPRTDSEVNVLRNLQESEVGEKLDFWVGPSVPGRTVDIMVSPSLRTDLTRTLGRRGMKYGVWIEDVQERMNNEREDVTSNAWGLTKYNTYVETQEWIQDMANAYPFASRVSLGKSFENRDIGYLRLNKGGTSKNAFVFHGGIHAREWISPATVIYMTDLLLKDSDTSYLDNLDIYIIPVLNVDGYEYTHENDRMWRKNRNTNSGARCTGVDLNRNWAKGFGGSGSSGNVCSETYHGTEAISERESQALDNLLKSLGSRLKGYIDFHAYSQMWMTPWGYTYDYPTDYDAQYAVAKGCADAIQAVYGTPYLSGTTSRVVYQASGVTQDYTYASEHLNVLHSYGVELRDTGRYGFILPADQIDDSGIETYEALKVVMNAVRNA